MTTKLILASLVLGSSTLAMAAPAAQVTITERANGTTVIRDYREPVITHPILINEPARPVIAHPVFWHAPVYPSVTLAADQQIFHGRTVINVGRQAGRFATIKLEADGGRTYVQKVVVKFANGERQVMSRLDHTLVGDDSLTLDLAGNRRAIASIAVYGQEMNNGFRYERGAFRLTAS
ncbi:MAG TPA: hypothetical protein VFP84_13000 [Kofleriaceae bacterium]|nr:hypothetical protein [Kofleriaceae bacterium]